MERERILQLATSAATRDTLLGLFASGSIPEAIAKVEGTGPWFATSLRRILPRKSRPSAHGIYGSAAGRPSLESWLRMG